MARKILIDAGAHCGCTRRLFRNKYDKKKEFEIYSFEPDESFNQYCTNLINKAVWIKDGTIDYHKFGISGGSTVEVRKADQLERTVPIYTGTRQIISVPCIDIDKWIKENFSPDDHIILKLDIEGGEYTVLPHMIKNGSIKYINKIWIEWHNVRLGIPKSVDENLKKQIGKIPITKWDAMLPGYCIIRGKISD